jgi:hypothetical protein
MPSRSEHPGVMSREMKRVAESQAYSTYRTRFVDEYRYPCFKPPPPPRSPPPLLPRHVQFQLIGDSDLSALHSLGFSALFSRPIVDLDGKLGIMGRKTSIETGATAFTSLRITIADCIQVLV